MINVCLIGCGRISKNHIKAICKFREQAKLVALCDESNDRLKEANELLFSENGTKALEYNNYNQLLDDVVTKKLEADLVVLATPSGLHPEQAIQAGQAGLDVCSEKPMAVDLESGKKMVRKFKELNRRLFIVKQNRFNSTLRLVKKQIEEERFGKIALIQTNVFWQRPQDYYNQAAWRGTWKLDGGALMNQASHYVDLMVWLFGDITELSAFTCTRARNIEAEDTAVVALKWSTGAIGTMNVTDVDLSRKSRGFNNDISEKGSVKIGGKAVNKIEKWIFEKPSDDDKKIEEVNYETTSVYGFGHPAFYKDMFESLLSGRKGECEGEEGLRSLELLEAAYKSSSKQIVVKLPLT